MEHFLVNENVICYLPPKNKATLIMGNYVGHDLLKSVDYGFGDYLIPNVA